MRTETAHDLAADGIRRSVATLERLLEPEYLDAIVAAARTVAGALQAGGKLLVFGNGGSAADAQHIAAEFLGRYLLERDPLPAIALADNAAAVTAIGNDYAFADVFARQVAGLGTERDVALALSTSGSSPNVLAGVVAAKARGMRTIGLTGGDGGPLADAVDICIIVPDSSTPRIQEGHILVAHQLCELVERDLAGHGRV